MTFRALLEELTDAGLWAALTDAERRAVLDALEAGDDVTWAAGGAWRADGEDLAEGEVEAWLRGMAGSLADCGVELDVETVSGPHEQGSGGYSVAVNGTTIALYTFVPDEPGLPASEDPWMDCTILPVAEVNRLLAAAGGDHRVAVFWPGGNDGLAVLGDADALRRAAGRARALGVHGVLP